MGRQHTFMDREFGRPNYDPNDAGEFQPNLVFVIMPFQGDEMTETYSTIKAECFKLGLTAKRADENVGSGFVLREITELIEDAEFIICDLSHERPNVYYELGYAHGIGNEGSELLLIAKEGTILHFDIAPLRVQYYGSLKELASIVFTNLEKMIRTTRR